MFDLVFYPLTPPPTPPPMFVVQKWLAVKYVQMDPVLLTVSIKVFKFKFPHGVKVFNSQ